MENIMEAKEGEFRKAPLSLRRTCAKDILEIAGVGARNRAPEEGALQDFASLIATAFSAAQKRREEELKRVREEREEGSITITAEEVQPTA